jgi:hypothetical protein
MNSLALGGFRLLMNVVEKDTLGFEGDVRVELPMEVWAMILPFSFATVNEALSLGTVCRAWNEEMSQENFWSVWLRKRKQVVLEALISMSRQELFAVVEREYIVVPPIQCSMLELVQSKCEGFSKLKTWGSSVVRNNLSVVLCHR